MARSKVAISLDEFTLDRLDQLVKKQVFPNRSQAIEEAVTEKLARLRKVVWPKSAPNLILSLKRHLRKKGFPRISRDGPNTEGGDPLGRPESGTRAEQAGNVQF